MGHPRKRPKRNQWSIARLKRSGDARDYGSQKGDEIVLDASAGFEYFFRCERRSGDSGGHVGDAGNSQHADAAVPSGENFGNRGHPDEIGAERAERVNFRGRFVVGPGERKINAFVKIQARAFSPSSATKRRKSLIIGVSHVRESARPKRSSFGPISGLVACKLM